MLSFTTIIFLFASFQWISSPACVHAIKVSNTCNFENGKCGFDDLNVHTWFIADNTSQIDPGYDHTCDTTDNLRSCGHWLSTIKPSSFQGQQTFVLLNSDPVAIQANKPLCLSFWYHFLGVENARFEVQINRGKTAFDARTIWSKVSPQGNGWKRGYVDIVGQSNSNVYILFKATLNAQYHDTVGLDDISLEYHKCPKTPDCDFETDLCGWENTGFKRLNGNNTPTTDHTTGAALGHYLLLSGDHQKAVLNGTMPNIAPLGRDILYNFKGWYKFVYDNNSPNDAASYIDVHSLTDPYKGFRTTIQSIHNDGLTNQWVMFSMEVVLDNFDRSGFLVTAQTFGTTKIAIDDFLLYPGLSSHYYGGCDFETDFCGWSNAGKALWIRSSGRDAWGTLKNLPHTDTTIQSFKGWYAMVPIMWISPGKRAELRSPPLMQEFKCLGLKYWAYAAGRTNVAVLYVHIVDLTKTKDTVVHIINSTSEAKWTRFQVAVEQPPGKFSIRITSTLYSNQVSMGTLAIDDIGVSSEECYQSHEPTPVPSTPVPAKEKAWDCDFTTCHGWWFDGNWARTSFRKLKDKTRAPRIDHTTRSTNGVYLLWKPPPTTTTPDVVSNVSSVAPSIVRMSTNLTNTHVHCLSFWYFDSAEIPFQLSVFTVMAHTRYLTWRVVRSGVAQSWKHVSIPFAEMSAPGYIQIELQTGNATSGVFALDDLMVRRSTCDPLTGFVYDFDGILDDLLIINLQPIGHSITRIAGGLSHPVPNAPVHDFTTGRGNYLLFKNGPKDVNTTYIAEGVIPNVPGVKYRSVDQKDGRCVRFAYQLTGPNTTLKAGYQYVGDPGFNSPSFVGVVAHREWVVGHFSYLTHSEHNIVFSMNKPLDETSYIALDDITILNRPCNTPMDCDFDEDMCAFYFTYQATDDYEFTRMIGPPRDPTFPGPRFDHTRGSYGGGYLFMKGTENADQISYIHSAIRTVQRGVDYYCLSLWTQLTAPDAMVKITMNFYVAGGVSNYNIPVLTITNVTENGWTRHYATIVNKNFSKGYDEMEFNILGETRKAGTVVAIDDIFLEVNACELHREFKCQNGQKITNDKVEDFVDDCRDGSDEERHDCNFEQNMACSWKDADLGGESSFWRANYGNWKLVRGGSLDDGLYPKVDGSGQRHGFYLALMGNHVNQTYVRRALVRADTNMYTYVFKHSFHTCRLTFDYFAYSARGRAVSVRVFVGLEGDRQLNRRTLAGTENATWTKADVHLGAFSNSFSVSFQGSRYDDASVLAVDNIAFVDCGQPPATATSCQVGQVLCDTTKICIAEEDLCDFQNDCGDNWDEGYSACRREIYDTGKTVPNCDFEISPDYCGFSKDPSPAPGNVFVDSQGRSSFQYPSADHTTRVAEGNFVTLAGNYFSQTRKMARLYTPMMTTAKGGGEKCSMHFFYNNIDVQVVNAVAHKKKKKLPPSLRVFVRYADGRKGTTSTLFENNVTTFDWVKGGVKFSSPEPFQFVFEGELAGYLMSMSLDDVSFSQHCILSTVAYHPGNEQGKHHPFPVAVPIIMVLMVMVGAAGFYAYRRKQAGQVLMPFRFKAGETSKPVLATSD